MQHDQNHILSNLTLKDSQDRLWKLKDHPHPFTVIFFYPKALTSGCTQQALLYQEHLETFKSLGAQVIGVSKDPVKKLAQFAEKKELTFTLLSDEALEYIPKLGIWAEKSMYGKKYMGIIRSTFLLDEQGKIVKQWLKVKPNEDTENVLSTIKTMMD